MSDVYVVYRRDSPGLNPTAILLHKERLTVMSSALRETWAASDCHYAIPP